MEIQDLPALNATLNATAGVFISIGYLFVRQGHRTAHKRCMLAALATATLFLVSYVVYHASAGSRPYQGEGLSRVVYFTILVTHVVLAAAIVPLALVTANRGLRNRLGPHVRIARWTLPIWLYVSVTGVVIYLMLY
jgi:uncharacterized membrane protein YozB (DUF420 family)